MTDPQNTEKVALTDAEKDAIEWANFGEPNCELEDAVEAIIEARRAADLTSLSSALYPVARTWCACSTPSVPTPAPMTTATEGRSFTRLAC